MRVHGVTVFPDPGQDGAFNLPAQIDQQAPQFHRAMQACTTQQPTDLSMNQG
jgi:hypothetical protein